MDDMISSKRQLIAMEAIITRSNDSIMQPYDQTTVSQRTKDEWPPFNFASFIPIRATPSYDRFFPSLPFCRTKFPVRTTSGTTAFGKSILLITRDRKAELCPFELLPGLINVTVKIHLLKQRPAGSLPVPIYLRAGNKGRSNSEDGRRSQKLSEAEKREYWLGNKGSNRG